MNQLYKIIVCLSMPTLLCGCTTETPMVSLGIDSTYAIYRMKTLRLCPEYSGDSYEWTVPDADGNDSIVSTARTLYFVRRTPGEYDVTLRIHDADNPVEHRFKVAVFEEDVAYSRYITDVYEYCPAPGQFVNVLPKYEPGDTQQSMVRKVEESISGRNDVLVSLGGYGGYVTFGFDHTVVNVPGEYDLKIYGNAFYASSNPNPTVTESGGSAEPGIVMVSVDENQNGLPDDTWYELAGSEYYKPETLHGYSVTYSRPLPDHVAVGQGVSITDLYYIPFVASDGSKGYIAKNSFHTQDYFPAWIDEPTLTFTGTRLAPNAVDESHQGSYFVLYPYEWGYADNHPNEVEDKSCFDIGWAVDSKGNRVQLDGIDFVRVYTGVNQQCGWLGETSTEICRAEDLHINQMY